MKSFVYFCCPSLAHDFLGGRLLLLCDYRTVLIATCAKRMSSKTGCLGWRYFTLTSVKSRPFILHHSTIATPLWQHSSFQNPEFDGRSSRCLNDLCAFRGKRGKPRRPRNRPRGGLGLLKDAPIPLSVVNDGPTALMSLAMATIATVLTTNERMEHLLHIPIHTAIHQQIHGIHRQPITTHRQLMDTILRHMAIHRQAGMDTHRQDMAIHQVAMSHGRVKPRVVDEVQV